MKKVRPRKSGGGARASEDSSRGDGVVRFVRRRRAVCEKSRKIDRYSIRREMLGQFIFSFCVAHAQVLNGILVFVSKLKQKEHIRTDAFLVRRGTFAWNCKILMALR